MYLKYCVKQKQLTPIMKSCQGIMANIVVNRNHYNVIKQSLNYNNHK